MRGTSSQKVGYDSAAAGSRGSSIMDVTLARTRRDVKCADKIHPYSGSGQACCCKNTTAAGTASSGKPCAAAVPFPSTSVPRLRPPRRARRGGAMSRPAIRTRPRRGRATPGNNHPSGPDRPAHPAEQLDVRLGFLAELKRREGLHGWASRSVCRQADPRLSNGPCDRSSRPIRRTVRETPATSSTFGRRSRSSFTPFLQFIGFSCCCPDRKTELYRATGRLTTAAAPVTPIKPAGMTGGGPGAA